MLNYKELIYKLCNYPNELEWVEFKHNNCDPKMIAEDISALANSATLHEQNYAYMLWGIEDQTHKIVGTKFNLQDTKKGNEELENWLRGNLSVNADFEFHTVPIEGVNTGLLIIHKAAGQAVTFGKTAYIRVGSYTKKMADYPSLESNFWRRLHDTKFEDLAAMQDLSLSEALTLLDYTSYFHYKKLPIPTNADGIVYYLLQENILKKQEDGFFSITNLGAVLFAKQMDSFPKISRKAIRIVQYEGTNRLQMKKQYTGKKGYASEFEEVLSHIQELLPSSEIIEENGIRTQKSPYPFLAIREIVANALIHQEFSITGTGPVVEIFDNRIEFTNPGHLLVDVNRIIDNPPKSRNERLASLMRKLGICEELGTGWDKIAISCELFQLPAPRIDSYEENTKITLYSKIPFTNLSPDDKIRSCYFHACIKQVQGEQITNSSLRERFDVPKSSSSSISRLIKEAVEKNWIKPLDPETAPKHMRYIPFWG